MRAFSSVLFVVLLFALPEALHADTTLEERLKKAFEKYPQADTNKDGVLSLEEAKAFRQKMKAGKTAVEPASEAKAKTFSQSPGQPFEPKRGGQCLFLGHSFFIPVAKTFDELAREMELPRHQAQFVMSGGGGGAPGRIWQSPRHRKAATDILQSGTIEVLGMTYYDETNCSAEDYGRWIDLAAKHNPDVHIFIGMCWPDSPEATPSEFDKILGSAADRLFKTVSKLRRTYPNLSIQFVNYGKVASELKSRHSDGALPQIESLIGRTSESLFRDQKGHAGPMLRELAASIWLQQLYSVDVARLQAPVAKSKEGRAILSSVAAFNEQFK
ncbi:MAG: hypothetical protein AAFU85_08960 [Planctomycetota bacterium]